MFDRTKSFCIGFICKLFINCSLIRLLSPGVHFLQLWSAQLKPSLTFLWAAWIQWFPPVIRSPFTPSSKNYQFDSAVFISSEDVIKFVIKCSSADPAPGSFIKKIFPSLILVIMKLGSSSFCNRTFPKFQIIKDKKADINQFNYYQHVSKIIKNIAANHRMKYTACLPLSLLSELPTLVVFIFGVAYPCLLYLQSCLPLLSLLSELPTLVVFTVRVAPSCCPSVRAVYLCCLHCLCWQSCQSDIRQSGVIELLVAILRALI